IRITQLNRTIIRTESISTELWAIILTIIIIGLTIFGTKKFHFDRDDIVQNPFQIFETKLNDMKKIYPNQDIKSWTKIKSAVRSFFEHPEKRDQSTLSPLKRRQASTWFTLSCRAIVFRNLKRRSAKKNKQTKKHENFPILGTFFRRIDVLFTSRIDIILLNKNLHTSYILSIERKILLFG
uniref:Translocon at the inner envelope membrane of chloroplasts 214 n=1 Tax=Romanomermis culicivorax TaxID=13658 RepID=A0A915L077_ROMCU